MLLYKMIGQKIRESREKRAVTQEELAGRIGLTRTSISNIEAGRQKVTINTVYKICDALDVEPFDIFPFLEELRSERRKKSIIQVEQELQPNEAEWVKTLILMAKSSEGDDV